MTAKGIRCAVAVVILCLGGIAVGAVGGAGAKPTGKVKFDTKSSGGSGIEGVVKHKQKKGRKNVKVILKGPAPFDPSARASGGLMRIGVERTDNRGRFCFEPPDGGSFNAGKYKASAKKPGFKYRVAVARL